MFGEYVKERRLVLGFSLRTFCRCLKLDPSNWSKIERGILHPPKDKKTLEKIIDLLEIREGTAEAYKFYDYADIDCGSIPKFIIQDKDVVRLLPAFFRIIDDIKPTKAEILELLEGIREARR